jgi:hypothetical protein
MATIRKILIVLLLSIFLVEFGTDFFLNAYYSSHLPGVPDEKAARIYRMNANRFTVYGMKQEFQCLSVAEKYLPLAGICGLIAGILNFKYGNFPPTITSIFRKKPPC